MARVFRIIWAALSLFLFLAGAFPALAQQQTPQSVSVRASAQGDHVRVVFDWPQGPGGYTLAEEDGRGLILAFNGAARFDLAAAGAVSGGVYNGAEIRSADPPTVFVKTGDLRRFRHFRAGNRVIVDLYGATKSAETSKPVASSSAKKEKVPVASPAQTEKKATEEKKEKPADNPAVATSPSTTGAPSMPAAPAVAVASERLPRPVLEPHLINFTTTEAVGMAAFMRGGALWIVFDRPDVQPAPQIAGPQKNLFPPFERVALTGGTAFRLQMPGDARFYAEGGGLIWRIVVTPVARDVTPVQAERKETVLFWPLTHARRALEVPDPATGDTLRVVTVSRAEDFSGPGQSFVELDALPSSLGLAIAPKVDDLEVSVTEGKGVTVSRPKGLSLSEGAYSIPGDLPEPEDIPLQQTAEKTDPQSGKSPAMPPNTEQKPGDDHKSDETAAPPAASSEPPNPPESSQQPSPPESAEKKEPEEKAPEPGKESAAPAPPSPAVAAAAALPPVKEKKIFDFQEWTMGGQSALRANKRLIMLGMAGKDDTGKVEDLLSLAKMYLANGWGAEALGYLRIVTQILPELEANPRFVALRGAAEALSGKYEMALKDLLNPVLDEYDDIGFWRAWTLARLQDWRQAAERMPKDFHMLDGYPSFLRDAMGMTLAEITLRDGNVDLGEGLLGYVGKGSEPMRPGQSAARDYLRAEILRQKGEKDKAAAAFEVLAKGRDRQYRARAGLALTNLLIESKKIDTKEAAERLERLRFAWRGDEFEPLVNYRLGALYLEDGQYAKGLSILRDTVEEAPGNGLTEQITGEMLRSFRDIFMTEKLDKLSPLDAITLYEEFRELVPPGAEGDKLTERLAEHLAAANLYGRAGDILEYQLAHTLKGADAVRTAVRLAAIRLLDGRPEAAIAVLDRAAGENLNALDDTARKAKIREMALLRARALSKMDKSEQALGILNAMPPDEDVNRLRVDIAWGAGNWDEAAQAMQDIILDEDIPPRGPIKPDQATLLLNRAVALNLADNRVALANMRDRFGTAMNATDQGKLFDVVTRPRQNSVLADRQTLTGVVSEVDMFKNFLETVRGK